jgi:Gas vesicle protein G
VNPFSLILGLPTLPVRGVLWLGRVIQDQAERELHDPASIRHMLEEAETAKRQGRISEADEERVEHKAVDRMMPQSGTGGGAIEAQHREKEDDHD